MVKILGKKTVAAKPSVVKVGEQDGRPVFVEVMPLNDVIGHYNTMVEDHNWAVTRARSPKEKRNHAKALQFFASTLFHLNKLKEAHHG